MGSEEKVSERFAAAWETVTGLALQGFRDVRIDGSCPSLEFLRAGGRPEYADGLFRQVAAAVETLGFRFRLRLAYQMRDLGPEVAARHGRTPRGLTVFGPDRQRWEVAVLANLPPPERLRVALHEFGHAADAVAAVVVGEPQRCWETGGSPERAYRELVADVVAAVLAEMHRLQLYRYVTAVQVTLWRLHDAAGRPPDPQGFAETCLCEVARYVGQAVGLAVWALSAAAETRNEGRRDVW